MTHKIQTIGIAVDNWKLPIFKDRLQKAGFAFTEHPGLAENATLLKVETTNVQRIARLVNEAHAACALSKRKEN